MSNPERPRSSVPVSRALRITAVYAVLASAWIYASDGLLGIFISDPRVLTTLAMSKGWLFVILTSALLYNFARRRPGAEDDLDLPPASPDVEKTFTIWPPLLIFVVFAGLIVLTALFVYTRIARGARLQAEETLGAIADLKARQIADWLSERQGNAERASHDPFMATEVESWLARGAPDDAKAKLIAARLDSLRTADDWSEVSLFDTSGRMRLDPAKHDQYPELAHDLALEAIRTRQTVFWDFHREVEDGKPVIEIGFVAPLLAGAGDESRAVGAVVMEIDPSHHLYPMIENWPLKSQSGETLLVKRAGDSIVYLSRLRHSTAAPLTFSLPSSSPQLVAAEALRGAGTSEGRDYRKVPVLASMRAVPTTSWALVAKIDLEEVNGPVAERGRLLALFGLVLIAAAGLATLSWARQQRASALLRHFVAQRERETLARHLDLVTRYANDIILLMDDHGTIVDANERALGTYGYTREELVGANVRMLRTAGALDTLERDWKAARQQDGVVFETEHCRKDGSPFPVEVSSRAMDVNGVLLRQSIIRDITERIDAQRKIVRLGNLYAAISQLNQTIVRGKGRQHLFEQLCRVSVEYGRLKFAWVGIINETSGMVEPVAQYGDTHGYVDNIRVSVSESEPTGLGPTGFAIRTREIQVRDDFLADPLTAPWRDAAIEAGVHAVAALPILCGGKTVGALSVYSGESGFFDDQTIVLLGEMVDDVNFALDALEKEEQRHAAEEALRESEEKYRLLFTNEQDAIVVFDAATTQIVEVNEAFTRVSGYSEAEARTLHAQDLSTDPEGTRESIRTVRDQGHARVDARGFRRRDGSEILVEIGLNAFVWRGRRLVSAIVRDITEKRKAEESAIIWGKVLEESAEGIMITDPEQRILDVNKAFAALTGYTDAEVVGKTPKFLASGRHDRAFYHVMWRTIRESGRWQGEIWNRRKNGELFLEWLSITAVRNAAGILTHYVGIFSDITERKESADRIEFLASHDSLTGLPNRLLMNDLIHQSVAAARRKGTMLSLLFLDLDRFKTINDSLGHSVGDILLQHVAERLTGCVREGDTVARLGGDEFLIMLPELVRSRDAAVVAEKIIQSMRTPIRVAEHELPITASIGISVFPHDGGDGATLIKNSDAAMYHAKEHGRNNYQFFMPDMNARAFEALSMEMSLRGALERNEFTLHYQPQVHTQTGRIVGTEALIRWRHRDLGFVPPSRFIPIAEEHGLIVSIGEWVLRTACQQVRDWLDAGLPAVPVAVNMSAVQFRQSRLASRVASILAETGVSPQFLELELTESIIMRDAEQAIAVLLELNEMGVSLSIDDFGTGYSSLSYLRRFPIQKLKIDRTFVSDIPNSLDACAIATAIIGMGRSLKLRVIAEGVETAEQLQFLRSNGCDELQGYHLGRPVEASIFSDLLRRDQPLIASPTLAGDPA